MVREALAREWRRASGAATGAAVTRAGRIVGRAADPARSRRQHRRALRPARHAGHSRGDAGAHRRRAHRPALSHQHHAALPRRPRRRQGRRAVRGRPGAAANAWGCSSSRRARPTSRRSCSAPTSAARCPTPRAKSWRAGSAARRTLVVIYGDGLSAAAINQHLAEFHGALLPALAARGISHAPPFFVRRSRVKIMDEIARLTGAQAALFTCGERPGPRLRRFAVGLLHLSAGGRRDRRRPRGDVQHQPARPRARRGRGRRRRPRSSASCARRSRA